MNSALRKGVLCISLLLSACHGTSPTVDGKTHVFTLKQKCPALLQMKVGQSLMFHAPENPSTGYQWQITKPLSNFNVEQSEQKPKTEQPDMVGQPTEKIFQFYATQAGEEEISLSYIRPWETTAPPVERWVCRVRISS
ncbi:protease inhibitor I42 family protein [Acinetobacter rathckeae]|uniref:protease inhibitor I42 family protein n=1 Tax=Acinetobacter rathckeae TaxID=2605272 RepID=UPI0018A2D89B|nr:protease inhibitor I42 family protein [Acinetobacter rathckeae]MBF7688430.1 protease inhibitor I42 family protein [Acinetobacter rathckeae]MBF7695515.1 protease inhibitor I42 family protein [Acinetobacter rathckeae]